MKRLEGLGAVVTGGARGIGAAIARAYADEGASVAILDVDARRAAETAASIGRGCRSFTVDVADEALVEAAFDALDAAGFRVDILVNNAAVQREAALADQTLADARLVIDT
ncbi:MAG TPA: SDR family NAD(P)-dependent oxidoreductase, partial [Candidatus Limnocylindrales bacterium]|nr:SDR family NAD(P)-dependent oxidoreductase [Candidatus Limnocylindrales bacterium]